MYLTDYVGRFAREQDGSLIGQASEAGVHVEGEIGDSDEATVARLLAVPVRRNGEMIAVLTKEWVVRAGRPLGELERNYSRIFEQFVR